MTTAAFILCLSVSAAADAPARPMPGRPAPARPGLSWADADALARKLDGLVRHPPGTPLAGGIVVTQGELNSYLNLSLGPQMPQGLADVDVSMEPDALGARAIVDLDQLKDRLPPMGAFNPISYLGGRVPVELHGRVQTANGVGSIAWDRVRLGGYSLPVSVLAQIVSQATKTRANPQGVDIQAPFPLPYAIKRVRIEQGRALLEP